MPFKSEAQRGFLFARHPKIAKEFAKKTPEGANLPEHVGDKRSSQLSAIKRRQKKQK